MVERIKEIELEINKKIKLIKEEKDIDLIYKKYFGKAGILSIELRKMISEAKPEEKKTIGPLLNNLKEVSITKINKIRKKLQVESKKIELENKKTQLVFAKDLISAHKLIEIQKEIKGKEFGVVKNSPLLNFIKQIEEFFLNLTRNLNSDSNDEALERTKELIMKKRIVFKNNSQSSSPLETTEYNFKRLNIDETHPAWSSGDVFWINKTWLLRSHCTSSTARKLEENKNKSFASYTIGNVLRPDSDDATHSHQFVQLDVVAIASKISVWQLQEFLQSLLNYLFSKKVETRFRASYFPFTSPSFEVDIKCSNLENNCSICKGTGWIEVLEGGMVDMELLIKAGYDEETIKKNNLTGWAFGLGVDRLLCLVKNISDIRVLYR